MQKVIARVCFFGTGVTEFEQEVNDLLGAGYHLGHFSVIKYGLRIICTACVCNDDHKNEIHNHAHNHEAPKVDAHESHNHEAPKVADKKEEPHKDGKTTKDELPERMQYKVEQKDLRKVRNLEGYKHQTD